MSILQMSVSASILILFIIVIRAVLLNKLPQKTFIILWGVTLFRLLVPISVPSQFSVFTLIKNLTSLSAAQNIDVSSPNMGIAETMPAARATVTNGTLQMSVSPLLILWLVGMFAVALFITITHLRCRQSYKMALPIENAFLAKWKKEYPTKRTIQIKQSDKIDAPLTYGIVRPVILLPKSMNHADECKLQYVLAHEFTHIKRFDVLLKYLLAASLCVHWFNPLVWAMYILFNRDVELSCDETVVRAFGGAAKSAYARTLISMEERKSRLTPLCNNFSKNAIEERITAIMKIKKTSLVTVLAAAVLIISVSTVFATSAEVNKGAEMPSASSASAEKNIQSSSTESQKIATNFFAPVKYDGVSFAFGGEHNHTGVDLKAAKGTEIYAAADGTVSLAKYDPTRGNMVIIAHENGYESMYEHCSELLCKEGDTVRQGDLIAKVGSTGNSTGPHLHFELHLNGKEIDPGLK